MAEADVPVGATRTSIRLIEALLELNGAGISELAARLDLPTSTVYDHLETLQRSEFVIATEGEYRLSTRFLEIGGRIRRNRPIHKIAEAEIQKLARETNEHANLMVEEFGQGVFLIKAKGPDAFELDTHVGMRVHLQTTALGKAILAHLPPARVDEIIDRHGLPSMTQNTITDRDALEEELQRVRDRGFATDDEERIAGMRCVAAPIRDENGSIVASISVSGPKNGMQGQRFEEEIPNLVRRTANVIEVNRKYR